MYRSRSNYSTKKLIWISGNDPFFLEPKKNYWPGVHQNINYVLVLSIS